MRFLQSLLDQLEAVLELLAADDVVQTARKEADVEKLIGSEIEVVDAEEVSYSTEPLKAAASITNDVEILPVDPGFHDKNSEDGGNFLHSQEIDEFENFSEQNDEYAVNDATILSLSICSNDVESTDSLNFNETSAELTSMYENLTCVKESESFGVSKVIGDKCALGIPVDNVTVYLDDSNDCDDFNFGFNKGSRLSSFVVEPGGLLALSSCDCSFDSEICDNAHLNYGENTKIVIIDFAHVVGTDGNAGSFGYIEDYANVICLVHEDIPLSFDIVDPGGLRICFDVYTFLDVDYVVLNVIKSIIWSKAFWIDKGAANFENSHLCFILADKDTFSEEGNVTFKSYTLNSQDYKDSCMASLKFLEKTSLVFSCTIRKNDQFKEVKGIELSLKGGNQRISAGLNAGEILLIKPYNHGYKDDESTTSGNEEWLEHKDIHHSYHNSAL